MLRRKGVRVVGMSPEEVKELWIEALESGDYPQGRLALLSSEGFCCLGVLCDLYRQKTGIGEWEEGTAGARYFLGQSKVLPEAVARWAGIVGGVQDPWVRGKDGVMYGLAHCNDSGWNFGQIARILREAKRVGEGG